MIPHSPSLPDISTSKPLRSFRLGKTFAVLFGSPRPYVDDGLISYIWALAVFDFPKGAPDIVLVITSELTGSELREAAQTAFKVELPTTPHLCFFDSQGRHFNLGQSAQWADMDVFLSRALTVAQEQLKIADHPIPITEKQPPIWNRKFGFTPRQWTLGVVATAMLGLLIYPPYTVPKNLAGTVFVRGNGWIFDLPQSASVDIKLLLTSWLGLLIVGAIGYFLFSKDR
jgi:hypothetical protein